MGAHNSKGGANDDLNRFRDKLEARSTTLQTLRVMDGVLRAVPIGKGLDRVEYSIKHRLLYTNACSLVIEGLRGLGMGITEWINWS